jgi:hypothetical protein
MPENGDILMLEKVREHYMNRIILPTNPILILLAAMLLIVPVLSQTDHEEKNFKLAQTGYQFLSIGSDARAGAMADAMTTVPLGAGSLFFNPAGMAHLDSRLNFLVSQNNWIADITHHSFAISFNPWGGRFGVLGFTLMNVDYGDFLGTVRWDNLKGYIDTGVFSPTALATGLGYAVALSDRFSVGAHIKYAAQYLGESLVPTTEDTTVDKHVSSAIAYDFGTLYKTGFKDLVFGMSVRNFSNEIEYASESFQLPLTFRIGISMDLLELLGRDMQRQSLLLAIDAAHPRSHPEYVNFGLEYRLMGVLTIRGGYATNMDEQGANFGFGLRLAPLTFDYAYTDFGIFNSVQRFSLRFSI